MVVPAAVAEVAVAVAVVVVAAAVVAAAEVVAKAPLPQKENLYPWGGGGARVRVRYNSHLPALYLSDRESTRSILVVTILPTLHGAVIFKYWHLCGSF